MYTELHVQLYYARSAWMLSNLDNPRGTDSHLIGHAFSEPAGLIRGMGLSDACAKSIESTDSVPANCNAQLGIPTQQKMRWCHDFLVILAMPTTSAHGTGVAIPLYSSYHTAITFEPLCSHIKPEGLTSGFVHYA